MTVEVRLGNYKRDMRALQRVIGSRLDTDTEPGQSALPSIEIILSTPTHRMTAILRRSDLYLIGFETNPASNAQRWFFADAFPPEEKSKMVGKELDINSSYAKPDGLAIFCGRGDDRPRDLGSFHSSIAHLSSFGNLSAQESIKNPLADICFLLPEALRSHIVFDQMIRVCENRDRFRFVDFKAEVKWAKNSRPGSDQNWEVKTRR